MEAIFTFQTLSCVIGVDVHVKLYFRTAFWQYDMTQGGKSISHKKGGKVQFRRRCAVPPPPPPIPQPVDSLKGKVAFGPRRVPFNMPRRLKVSVC